MLIFFGLITCVIGLIGAFTSGLEETRKNKIIWFCISGPCSALSCCLFYISGVLSGVPTGTPLTERDLALNRQYEVMADMGSAGEGSIYPKHVLLKKEGEERILFFVLQTTLPENSRYIVPRRFAGEKQLLFMAGAKPE